MKIITNKILLLLVILAVGCKDNKEVAAKDSLNPDSKENVSRNLIYFDATANFDRFTFKDSIDHYLKKVKDVGITDVIIDIKPISGEVLYPSKIAPIMLQWEDSGVKKDTTWDMLSRFIDVGHQLDLKVHVSTNIFVGGHNYYDRGLVYDDPAKKDWQSLSYLSTGFTPITEQKNKYSAMLNPDLDAVQKYQLSILEEIVEMYPNLDGIILDRVRYDGINTDFSDSSKVRFEKYIGESIDNFPDAIMTYNENEEIVRGELFNSWIEYRATVIHDFIYEARERVKAINEDIIFGDYTGSWYPTYYEVGVNWASKDYDPSEEYDWASENYKNTGYADALDIFLTGNYFYEVEIEEVASMRSDNVNRTEAGQDTRVADWYTVEGSADLVNKVVGEDTEVYAGIYVEQYNEDREQFIKALQMCKAKSQGAMIFDIVHIIDKDWWDELAQGLN